MPSDVDLLDGASPQAVVRLHYFEWAGRAGPIRDCLYLGAVPFEDVRHPVGEFRRQRDQGRFPFGLLPALELPGGRFIGQSNTILRWAARRAGLLPSEPEAVLQLESILDMVEDYAARLSVSIRESDPAVRAHLRAGLAERWMPELYANLSDCLRSSGSSWLVGTALSAADLKAFHLLVKLTDGSLDGMPTDALRSYPQLVAWMGRVDEARACLTPR